MGFEVSDRAKEINERLEAFMEEYIYLVSLKLS